MGGRPDIYYKQPVLPGGSATVMSWAISGDRGVNGTIIRGWRLLAGDIHREKIPFFRWSPAYAQQSVRYDEW